MTSELSLDKAVRTATSTLDKGQAREAATLARDFLSAHEQTALETPRFHYRVGRLYGVIGRAENALTGADPKPAFTRGWELGDEDCLVWLFEHLCFRERQYAEALALTEKVEERAERVEDPTWFVAQNRVAGYCLLKLGNVERATGHYSRLHGRRPSLEPTHLEPIRRELDELGDIAAPIVQWFGLEPKPSAAARDELRRWWDSLEPYWKAQFRTQRVKGEPRSVREAALASTTPPSDVELASLLQLTEFAFDSDFAVSTMEPLARLEHLQVVDAEFMDGVPAEAWTTLARLKHLRRLLLRAVELNDVRFVEGLRDLRELNLSKNSQLADLSPLSRLTELRRLHATCASGNIDALSGLIHLRELRLAGPVKSLEPLSALTALEHLEVKEAQLVDLRGLENLSDLRKLEVASETLEDVSVLTRLTRLEELSLRATKAKDFSPLGALTALEELALTFSSVATLEWARSLKKLKHLDVSFTGVTDLSPLADCPRLAHIDAFREKATMLGVGALKGLEGLKHLELNTRKASSKELAALKKARPALKVSTPRD